MFDGDISFDYINPNGSISTYKIIDKFEKNNKKFVIYVEDGKSEIYAAFYEIIDDKMKIIPIDDDNDYNIVDEYLENL